MTKLVMVEAISQYRMRYVVEMKEENPNEWAEDTVVMGEATEFSQLWLGEVIVSSREISEQEMLQLCDKDNEYTSSWDLAKKRATFVTPEKKTGTQVDMKV